MYKAIMVAPLGVTAATVNGQAYKVGKDRTVKIFESDISLLMEQGFTVEGDEMEQDGSETEGSEEIEGEGAK